MKDLAGKVVAVIGATGGIGDPFAEMSVRNGAKVALAARKLPELHALQQRIDPEGKFTLVHQTDASLGGETSNLLNTASGLWGLVDIVIVTVGTWRLAAADTDPKEAASAARVIADSIIIPSWNAILETDQFFQKQKKGLGIHMSSHTVLKNEKELRGNTYYRGAKKAVESQVESLIVSSKNHEVRWVNLQPAIVDTPINRRERPDVTAEQWAMAVQPADIFDWVLQHVDDPSIPDSHYFHSNLVL